MKKYCLYLLMPLMIILCSCNSTTFSESLASSLDAGSDSDTTLSQFTDRTSTVQLLQGGVYENSELSFQITFPDSWKDYYVINWQGNYTDKSARECIRISFYGESEHSHDYDDLFDITGLPMFYICTQNYLDSRGGGVAAVEKIGSVGDKNFYKFIQTDYPLDNINPQNCLDDCTTEEQNKVERDYEKAKEMETEIEEILKSFKSIQ